MMKKASNIKSSEEITSKKSTEPAADSHGSSDDSDAPVGVSWKDSKVVFKQKEKNRNDAVKFARSADKAKRRKKNEMFVSQKEIKRKLVRLPDDIVQAVTKKQKQFETIEFEEDKNKKLKRRKLKKKREKKNKETDDHFNVVILQDEVIKSKKVHDSAAEFLKTHFYGDRLHRTSGSKQLTMQSKSYGVMKPAVKFCSNKL